MAHNWAMTSRLARAAYRPAALLLAFVLVFLGLWFGVMLTIDRSLLDRLRQVPGVAGVTDRGDRIDVLISNRLSPEQTQDAFDLAARLAKNQLFYRWRPVVLGVGPFSVRIEASPPAIQLGRFRADIAKILAEHGGVVSGELGNDARVRVELEPGIKVLDWAMTSSELLERYSVTGLVTMAGTDEELSLYSGTPAHRKQLWDLHHAITGTGGDIAWLSVSENKTAGRIAVPDRATASAVLDELGHVLHDPTTGEGITLTVAEELALIGLGDHRAAFEFVDRLTTEHRRVTGLRTDLTEVHVVADNPEAIDSLLEMADRGGLPMPGEGSIRVGPAVSGHGGFAGRPGTIARLGRLFQSLWRAGYPDVTVTSGNARRGCQVGFSLDQSGSNDFTNPKVQAGLIDGLRALDWPGLGCFAIAADPRATTLTFISSRDGQATNVVPASRPPHGGTVPWSARFIDRWNHTATS